MWLTPSFNEWNWKQALFVAIISGPIGWVLAFIASIIDGIKFVWNLLGKESKKS